MICDVFDIFRALISQSGLLQKSSGLFVLEILSLLLGIAVIVIFCKFPRLYLSDRAMTRELDWMRRQVRGGNHDDDPEVIRRRYERFRERYPDYEDLDIEEVVFDADLDGGAAPDKAVYD
mmetsp:Transcript_17513/g.23644  ORF Transcript_17513/g.23644 Transcript_17513/m.23644 type:complete len:120 (+) Transcript_17513:400-759(+)|eukprot:CAMPEP_0170455578 /NCGR_PEP_ID=MMETSP0123-20130129/3499_1 /TAXON_ID=182087 /ORGANISM="Favella ehrenbergii, Strain Fehren 1" /LENGTH=119 /DNA_ID=CAMNT_0010718769 /DNA_START=413 /DNA_END=772 /DNA_ORIENTATION=-